MSAQVQPVGQAPEVRGETSSTERAPASTRAALAPALLVAVGVLDAAAAVGVSGAVDDAVVGVVVMVVVMVSAGVSVAVALDAVMMVVVVVAGVVVAGVADAVVDVVDRGALDGAGVTGGAPLPTASGRAPAGAGEASARARALSGVRALPSSRVASRTRQRYAVRRRLSMMGPFLYDPARDNGP